MPVSQGQHPSEKKQMSSEDLDLGDLGISMVSSRISFHHRTMKMICKRIRLWFGAGGQPGIEANGTLQVSWCMKSDSVKYPFSMSFLSHRTLCLLKGTCKYIICRRCWKDTVTSPTLPIPILEGALACFFSKPSFSKCSSMEIPSIAIGTFPCCFGRVVFNIHRVDCRIFRYTLRHYQISLCQALLLLGNLGIPRFQTTSPQIHHGKKY